MIALLQVHALRSHRRYPGVPNQSLETLTEAAEAFIVRLKCDGSDEHS